MNYDEMKKTGVDKVEIVDSLKAPLLKLKIALNENSSVEEDRLVINIDDNLTDQTNRKQVIFPISKPLYYYDNTSDEFIIEPQYKGNKVSMEAYVKRKIDTQLVETPIMVGKDLSGVTLQLNFPDVLGTYSNYYPGLFSSEKYIVREEFSGSVSAIVLRNKNTLEVIETLYSQAYAMPAEHLTEITLPTDFGIVTNVIDLSDSFAKPMDYIKYYKPTGVGIKEETIELISYQPIVLNEGASFISTNYPNATIALVYPKDMEFMKYFLMSTFSYSLNNEDKFLTLDDLYFKDCFTKMDDNIVNAFFNKLTITCMNSSNNTFSLDCDGNLVVNSLVTRVKEEIPDTTTLKNLTIKSLNSSNNKFSLDDNGNLSVNRIETIVPISNSFNILSVYPVGSIYMSVNNTNPGTLFGGTWTQITGRFLYATNNSIQTGGGNVTGSTALTIDQIPEHNHRQSVRTWVNQNASASRHIIPDSGGFWFNSEDQGADASYTFGTGGSKGHTHPQTLPPYFTVYCWYRTA